MSMGSLELRFTTLTPTTLPPLVNIFVTATRAFVLKDNSNLQRGWLKGAAIATDDHETD